MFSVASVLTGGALGLIPALEGPSVWVLVKASLCVSRLASDAFEHLFSANETGGRWGVFRIRISPSAALRSCRMGLSST